MPIRWGGDMDDPDNPASPFMARPDVEAIAADMLGLMNSNRERQNAAEIAFVDQWVGIKHGLDLEDERTPLAAMTLFSKAAIKVMYESMRHLAANQDHDSLDFAVSDVIERLAEFIPPGYE